MARAVCVLAFARPPERWGFKRSKKGTSWWIKIAPERVPRCLLALKKIDIAGKALWPDSRPDTPPPAPSTIKYKTKRPRGKAARTAFDEKRHRRSNRAMLSKATRTAEAIERTTAVIAAANARVKREAGKRKAELKKQAQQLINREQAAEARRVQQLYLLHHPVGTA